jgi:hypothetical protein
MREIRISQDGDSVAIRSDQPADSPLAYGVFHAVHGGHWASSQDVDDWNVQQFTDSGDSKAIAAAKSE